MNKQTKIVATIGPACESEEKIAELITKGVNVFRFNFKHGEVSWHGELLDRVKKVAKDLGVSIGTLIDLQGPSFRLFTPGESLFVEEGQLIPFKKKLHDKEERALSISHPDIIEHLVEGQKILAEDGTFTFYLRRKGESEFLEVATSGLLKQRRNLNIPGAEFPCELLVDKDYLGLELAAEKKVDFIALSFVRSAKDVEDVRALAVKYGATSHICSKIETKNALDELEAIVKVSNSVMVARGDLGVELPIQEVPHYQKLIINTCLEHAVPVITATQMMQSMIESPFPTRAEVSDVANAVYDRTDAVMLSGESATGKFPAETITMMANTLQEQELHGREFLVKPVKHEIKDMAARICDAAYKLYEDYVTSKKPLAAFVVFTGSGRTAKLVSRYRAHLPIYAFAPTKAICDELTISYGVTPFVQDELNTEEVQKDDVLRAINYLKHKDYLSEGGKVIVLHGDVWGEPGGTSTIRVVNVK
jgi:pyruvate kinase